MMVIFLTGLVSMILLRTLRADYARYTAVSQACRTRSNHDLPHMEQLTRHWQMCASASIPEPSGTAQWIGS